MHYVFAAGTGILPFLDLFDYLLESALSSSKPSLFKNGFQLHVFLSFTNASDFVGSDICTHLAQVLEARGFGAAFSVTVKAKDFPDIRVIKTTQSNFDEEFIRNNVQPECSRVYVCGPPKMNVSVPTALKSIGISNDKIMLV